MFQETNTEYTFHGEKKLLWYEKKKYFPNFPKMIATIISSLHALMELCHFFIRMWS